MGNEPQGGWEHLSDYNSHHAASNSSRGESSNVLSPSLQSYLNANDTSWAGDAGSLAFPPQQRHQKRDPTAIYRAEIARVGRRFGIKSRGSGGRIPRSSNFDQKSTRLEPSAYSGAARGFPSPGVLHERSHRDGRTDRGEVATRRTGTGAAAQRSYRIEGFLERGLDGSVALMGTRSGSGNGRRRSSTSRYPPCNY